MKSDLKTVEKAKTGDQKAVAKLYKDNFKCLYKFIRYRVDTTEIAEDITAEVFIRAFKSIEKFEGRSSFKSWIYTIAKNLIFDWLKSKKRFVDADDDSLDYIAEETKTSTSSYNSRQNETEVKTILSKLKDSYKEVLELRFLFNYNIKETAEIMGVSEGNVKVLQNRAIKKAREITSNLS